MTNIFKNALLTITTVGCVVGNVHAADEQKNTDAKTWKAALASVATSMGTIACIVGANVIAKGHESPFAASVGKDSAVVYIHLLIPGVTLVGAGALYLFTSAKGRFNKLCSVAGTLITTLSSCVLLGCAIDLMDKGASGVSAAQQALFCSTLGISLAGLGYYLQPKNTETQQS